MAESDDDDDDTILTIQDASLLILLKIKHKHHALLHGYPISSWPLDWKWGRASNHGRNQQPPAVNKCRSAVAGRRHRRRFGWGRGRGWFFCKGGERSPLAVPPPKAIKNADVATPPASQVSSRRGAPPRSAAAAARGRYSELEIEGDYEEEDAVAKDSESMIFGSSTGRRGSGRGRGRGRSRRRGIKGG